MMPALAVRQLSFSMLIPADWDAHILAVGFRLRGLLGLALKQGCCFFDAQKTPCLDCVKRPHCHYGQSFETMQAVDIQGLGKRGSMPHAWALSVQQQGMRVHVALLMAGMEIAHEASWQAAVNTLGLDVVWHESEWKQSEFQYQWQGLTPVRLRVQGKIPRNSDEIQQALASSIVSKTRMLAALHGCVAPKEHLEIPVVSAMQWCESSRHAFRQHEKQSMSGWLMHVQWAKDTPDSWKPWLSLACELGAGRQTSFGLGRFEML